MQIAAKHPRLILLGSVLFYVIACACFIAALASSDWVSVRYTDNNLQVFKATFGLFSWCDNDPRFPECTHIGSDCRVYGREIWVVNSGDCGSYQAVEAFTLLALLTGAFAIAMSLFYLWCSARFISWGKKFAILASGAIFLSVVTSLMSVAIAGHVFPTNTPTDQYNSTRSMDAGFSKALAAFFMTLFGGGLFMLALYSRKHQLSHSHHHVHSHTQSDSPRSFAPGPSISVKPAAPSGPEEANSLLQSGAGGSESYGSL